MSRFGMVVAALQLAACIEALCCRDWIRAVIYGAFSVGSAGVAWR